ncbi:MAG: DUF2127 domain-containing protein [Tabrizicola sp.]|uniref:DUF2127 domain-containing protein n=1 Tax=Tabrizicola sp. TaxID=2005166 RepID=UPI002ABB540B|nr:DUF2127 domain-containing protein [Tabrizicola sp.]MDZ4087273.1 DUF2127 domain-containing protein [Tabrizicola sp.]
MLRHSRDRLLHWLFEASLAIKGLLTSLEALAGLGLIVTPNPLVARFVFWVTHFQIAEHPDDTLASWTLRAVQQFPVPTQHFYALYLLAHGGLKLTLVLLLWRKVVWAYPAAMVVLAGFVAYQLYEFVHAGTPILLLLAVFDLVMIGLVWQEWKALCGRVAPAA